MESQEFHTSKEAEWEAMREQIENTADRLGYPIDEGIKEPVIGLNLLNIPTISSCEGHTDWGMSAPWIEIAAPGEPDTHFEGEEEAFTNVAKKYGLSVEEVRHAEVFEAWAEAFDEVSKNKETEEFKKWREANHKLAKKTQNLLDEFYKSDEQEDPNVRLDLDVYGSGDIFRIWNGGEDYRPVPEDLTENEKEELGKRLATYQDEMQRFAIFLKSKFLTE